jgi:uncharacterized membrane protein YdjX (TVP38/TMEM64 family)
LFGTVAGGVSVVLGATIGAVCLFLAARYAFYDVLHAKAGPALLGVPLKIYVIATFIGIIPATFIIASVGNGVGEVLAAGETPDVSIIFEPHVLIPILGLALLALIPVFYKAWKARKDKAADNG